MPKETSPSKSRLVKPRVNWGYFWSMGGTGRCIPEQCPPPPAQMATHAGGVSSSLCSLQAAVPPKTSLPSPPKLFTAYITSRWGHVDLISGSL